MYFPRLIVISIKIKINKNKIETAPTYRITEDKPIKLKPNVIKYEAIPENKPKYINEIIIASKFIIQINKYTFIEKKLNKKNILQKGL